MDYSFLVSRIGSLLYAIAISVMVVVILCSAECHTEEDGNLEVLYPPRT